MTYRMLALLVLLGSLVSCKKNVSEHPDAGQGIGRCRVSGFTDYLNGSYAGNLSISYDGSGRLQ
jgi:hypothetical protein